MSKERRFTRRLAGLIACILLAAIFFRGFDLPVARFFQGDFGQAQGYGVSSTVILAGELLVIGGLAAYRMTRGHLPALGKALMIASLASVIAFAANDHVLKPIFGVPQPAAVLFQGARHAFHFMAGSEMSSFPSGHMMMAGAFAGVWMRLYPRTIAVLAALLALGMGILVAGDWHFLSDVVVGAVLGVEVGRTAGALWLAHTARHAG